MQGGDRRSARIESHAAEILALVVATPDIILAELAERLFKAHGQRFALLDAIAFTAQECMNFFAAAGYDRV
jgi:hypothetical protein